MSGFMDIDKTDDNVAYMPFDGFTTRKLGCDNSADAPDVTMRLDASQSRALLKQFDDAWDSGELHDVTDAVIDGITAMYQENAPELIYYMALYRIFSEFLDDVSEDVLPNEGLGFRDSLIWNKLYDFQKDAALAIINKLETYNGCILADSVGLGKTFTALAVIKYYESRNKDVLVLCPKKLRDNWITYNSDVVNNPIAGDRLQYDVLYHTDLSRTRGTSETGLPLDRLNWGAYGLVVIDESHNFRNGGDSASEDRMNRYQLLMEKVIKQGVKTKVLMLSATPVNNRFRDLRNQLALAYWGDPTGWSEKLRLENDIETVFRNAQTVYARWSKLPAEQRTTHVLTDMLDYDFFEVLDQVTVARSRKHIQRYYDMSAIGPFPKRLPPISKRPKLSTLANAINYREIYEELDSLVLAVYMPSSYVHPSKMEKYAKMGGGGNLTLGGRETGVRRLMTTNLLKRLESSVCSFRLTLERVLAAMNAALETIDDYRRGLASGASVAAGRVRLRPRRRERLRGGRCHEDPGRGHGLDELGARHRGGRRRHRGPDLDGARHRPRPRRQAHRAVRADPREVARPHQPGQPQGARVHRVLGHGGLPLRERLGLREARARPRVRQGHGRRLRLHDKGSAPAHAGGARLLLARVEGARRGGAAALRLRRGHRYRHRLHLGGPEPPGL